ncbi:MAG: peptidylprolyl isomerase [Nitrospinaceae bacterium]
MRWSRRFTPMLATVLAPALIMGAAQPAWPHGGHGHDDKPPISLPDVVAQVNGENITKQAILNPLKSTIQRYKDRGMALNDNQIKVAAKKLIDNEIKRRLILGKAKALGLTITPQQVSQRLERAKKSFSSESEFQKELESENLTLDQYKAELNKELLIDEVLLKELGGDIKVGDKQVRDYYEKNHKRYFSPEKRRANVILIKVEADASPEEEKQARDTLRDVRQKALDGKDFAELARMHSQDTLAAKGGDLGFFDKKRMFKPFSERAFSMQIGEVSEIFRTKYGFQILKVTGRKDAISKPLESVREDIAKILMMQGIEGRMTPYVAKLKEKAKIKVYF